MDDYISNWQRRVKSVRERILLLDVSNQGDTNIKCDILSQTNKQYTITIQDNKSPSITVSCTCPDFRIRNITCKHIYWLGYKKMGQPPEHWTVESLQTFIDTYRILQSTIVQGRNDTCPICLENIAYNYEQTVCCESECYNSVHKICWIRYFSSTWSTKCVVCRSWGMPEIF